MPYIRPENRQDFVDAIQDVPTMSGPGDLNYCLTLLCLDYINNCKGLSYQSINDAIGALECAKLEMYRRLASPYEDKKIDQNGDVY
jgi:hypothetical protein